MKDFVETLQALQGTSVPNLLVIAGFALILLAFVGRIGAVIALSPKRQKWAGIVGTLLLIFGVGLFALPVRQPDSTPVAVSTPTCPYHANTVTETLISLIHAESQAANNDDLALIDQIFAPDALILRGDTGEYWDNPRAYYEPTFQALDFRDAEHFDIHIIEITDQMAWCTSGSRGYYGPSGTTPTEPYDNPNPSDHWTFSKDTQGCWIITKFDFNASHIPFP